MAGIAVVLASILFGPPSAVASPESYRDWRDPTGSQQIEGSATYYDVGLMSKVVEYRRLQGIDIPSWPGLIYVALNRAGDLYRTVWVVWPDDSVDLAFVVDCANPGDDFDQRQRLGRVVEVSAGVAVKHGFYGVGPLGNVKVVFDPSVLEIDGPRPM